MEMDSETKTAGSVRIRRSKKPAKSYNLIDFVVTKKKNQKSKKIVKKILVKPFVKKGKVKRKKYTTVKKKVLRERLKKKENSLVEQIASLEEQIEVLEIDETNDQKNLQIIQHSRNFREYCDHFITQEIKHYSEVVLKDLLRYQENKFQQNPVKAKANRRYVVGFKEVKKFLNVERLKLIFIAPDLEKNSEIDKLVSEIKHLAEYHSTPYIFSIKRRKLGFLLLKKVPVSIVGIFDYQGTTENVNILLGHVTKEKVLYKNKTTQNN